MVNSITMAAYPETRHYRTEAGAITAGFLVVLLLLMFLLKWKLPDIPKQPEQPEIFVELNLPPDLPTVTAGGGGGGGNPVEAPGKAGVAPETPPDAGVNEDSKDIETNDKSDMPPAPKTTNPKPADKVVPKTSPVKTPPKDPVETPAPRVPRTIYKGNTTSGTGQGGNEASTYQRNGGSGTGNGVGNGSGNGGGTGGGTGGGNGTGAGTGNGPKRISGNRNVINPRPMDAGENLQGKVRAEISVSPDGVGTFIRAVQGSRYFSGPAIDIVKDWLRKNRFNKASDQSTVVYEFNFILGG